MDRARPSVMTAHFPSWLTALIEAKDFYYFDRPYTGFDFTIAMAARTAALVMVQHLLVLFPAVAIDAPGAGWQNAISDTRNNIWFALAVTALPFIPIGLLAGAIASLFQFSGGSLTGLVAGLLWLGATLSIASTLAAVIATRLYQAIGDRLNAPQR